MHSAGLAGRSRTSETRVRQMSGVLRERSVSIISPAEAFAEVGLTTNEIAH